MRPWPGETRDDVMSTDEIRWWLKELMDNRGWGACCLTRTLGLVDDRKAKVTKKADGRSWIYRGEQRRMSKQLKRIIAGEIVVENLRRQGRGWRQRAVLADRPEPLRQGLHWNINLARGARVTLKPPDPPAPILPNFRTAFANPRALPKSWVEKHVGHT